jgi:hypothetical protein
MRWREASKYRIGLNKSWGCNNHLLPPGEPALDFIGGLVVMFMP